MTYRIHLSLEPNPFCYYSFYMEIGAPNEEQAIKRALKILKNTMFKDVSSNQWHIDKVEIIDEDEYYD